jgi:hypothetical protein
MPKRSRKKLKPIPKFRSEEEERQFWEEHDSADCFDWDQPRVVQFPNLQPSTATISRRSPQGMLDELKVLAHQRDVPYQSLPKVFLADRLHHERKRRRREAAGARQANQVVERWGISRFVRMVRSKKPRCSVERVSLRSQLICRVVL